MLKRKLDSEKDESANKNTEEESKEDGLPPRKKTKEEEKSAIESIPEELQHYLFEFLGEKDRFSICLTSTTLKDSMYGFFNHIKGAALERNKYISPERTAKLLDSHSYNIAMLLYSELSSINIGEEEEEEDQEQEFFSPLLATSYPVLASAPLVPSDIYYRMVMEAVASQASLQSVCKQLIEIDLKNKTSLFSRKGAFGQRLAHYFMASLDYDSISMMLGHLAHIADLYDGGRHDNIDAIFHTSDNTNKIPFEYIFIQSQIKGGILVNINLPSIKLLNFFSDNPLFIPIIPTDKFWLGINYLLTVYKLSKDPRCLECLAFLCTKIKQSVIDYISQHYHPDDRDGFQRKINTLLDADEFTKTLLEKYGQEVKKQFETYCDSFSPVPESSLRLG